MAIKETEQQIVDYLTEIESEGPYSKIIREIKEHTANKKGPRIAYTKAIPDSDGVYTERISYHDNIIEVISDIGHPTGELYHDRNQMVTGRVVKLPDTTIWVIEIYEDIYFNGRYERPPNHYPRHGRIMAVTRLLADMYIDAIDPKVVLSFFAETVIDKNSFDRAFNHLRGIIPAQNNTATENNPWNYTEKNVDKTPSYC